MGRALEYQRATDESLRIGTILLQWNLLAEEALLAALAKKHGCPAVGWKELSAADEKVAALLPAAQSVRIGAIPYASEEHRLHVAFRNPSDLAAVDEVAAITSRRVAPAVTTEVRLLEAQERFYGRAVPRALRALLRRLAAEGELLEDVPQAHRLPPPPAFFDPPPAAPGPMPASMVAEPSPQMPSGPSAEPLPDFIAGREGLADNLIEKQLAGIPRVLLLAAGDAGIRGWRGRGPLLSPETVSILRIFWTEPTIFQEVNRTDTPHFGPLDRSLWPRDFVLLLGPDPPPCAIFPVRGFQGVTAFLYADFLGAPVPREEFARIERAVRELA